MVYWSTSRNKSCRNRPRRHSSSSFLLKSFSVSFPFSHLSVITYFKVKRDRKFQGWTFLFVKKSGRKNYDTDISYLNKQWAQRTTSSKTPLLTVPDLGRSPFLLETVSSLCYLWDTFASPARGRRKVILKSVSLYMIMTSAIEFLFCFPFWWYGIE